MAKTINRELLNETPSSRGQHRLSAVEYVPIDLLNAYAGNPRRHPERQLLQLVESIRTFGFTMPVLVDANRTIIAGHGRVDAARRLGLVDVPVLTATDWTEAQIRAYRVADNRLAELGEWDEVQLATELSVLIESDDFPLDAYGWHAGEVCLLSAGAVSSTSPRKNAKQSKAKAAPVSRIGDLWALGLYLVKLTQGELASPFGRTPPADFFLMCMDSALRRWASVNGVEPVLVDTGEKFAEVAQRRVR